jgi:hypothetical protein
MSNILGGKNSNFAYTPMSEDEQEALSRLVESDDLMIELVGYGQQTKFDTKPTLGDAILSIDFTIVFDRPEFYIPVYTLELVLRTRAGDEIYREKKTTGPNPILARVGETFSMNWAIQFKRLDPNIVKKVKSGAIGLTSRFDGAWKLNHEQQKMIELIEQGKRNLEVLNKTDLERSEINEKKMYSEIAADNEKKIVIPVSSKKQ